jgi:F420H(2)-dependent quinone reductase
LPFASTLLGRYPANPLAGGIYAATMAASLLIAARLWRHARRARLFRAGLPSRFRPLGSDPRSGLRGDFRRSDISLKTVSQLHSAIVHLSGGEVLGPAFGVPVVELHAVGRKSGQPRPTMLTAPVIEGDRVVLVALQGRR